MAFFSRPSTRFSIDRIAYVLLAVVLLGLIGLFFFFGLHRVLAPRHIVSFLPAQHTLLFVEGNRTPTPLVEKFLTQRGMTQEAFFTTVSEYLGGSLKDGLFPALGERAGLALLGQDVTKDAVFFLEVRDQEQAKQFFSSLLPQGESLTEQRFGSVPVYSFPVKHQFSFLFLDSYLVLSFSPRTLQSIVDTASGKTPALSAQGNYTALMKNVSTQALFFGYLSPEFLFSSATLPHYPTLAPFVSPLEKAFSGMTFETREEEGTLAFKVFTGMDSAFMKPLLSREKYTATLFSLLPEHTRFALGGKNLKGTLSAALDAYGTVSSEGKLLLLGLGEGMSARYRLSPSVYMDTLALFSEEYVVFMDDAGGVHIVLEGKDLLTHKEQLNQRIEELLSTLYAVSLPVVEKKTLPDGTQIEEVVLKDVGKREEQFTHKDFSVRGVRFSEQGQGFFVTYTDNQAFLSFTTQDKFTHLLDAAREPKKKTPFGFHFPLQGSGALYVDIASFFPEPLPEEEGMPALATLPFSTLLKGIRDGVVMSRAYDDGVRFDLMLRPL